MAKCPCFALAPLLLATAAAQHTCVVANNFLNAQYTVPVQVGSPPQTLHVVADTGSFEGVFASVECVGCGPHTRFNRTGSDTFAAKSPAEHITTLYGQGKVVSEAVYDRVTVGALVADQQSILLMQQNDLRDYAESSYDGVMGLGVPSVARNQDPDDLSLMTNLNVTAVSLCFGQHDGDGGRLELGSAPLVGDGLDFVQLPLLGDQHWAVVLDSITVGDRLIDGCENGCNAIIDSGTSLIAAPSEILSPLLTAIGDVDPSCAGIDALPDITVSLAGHPFTLKPQMYVALMEMADDDQTRASLAAGIAALDADDESQGEADDAQGGEDAQSDDEQSDDEQSDGANTGDVDDVDDYDDTPPEVFIDPDQPVAAANAAAANAAAANAQKPAHEERFDPLSGFRRRFASLQAERQRTDEAARMDEAAKLETTGSVSKQDVSKQSSQDENHEACVALFMDMDMVSSLPGRPFILGIPFLRAFVAKFDRVARTVGLAQVPVGSTYCTACNTTQLAPASGSGGANPTSSFAMARMAAKLDTRAAHSIGAASLSSGFSGAAVTETDAAAHGGKGGAAAHAALQPTSLAAASGTSRAEERAAHLEAAPAPHPAASVANSLAHGAATSLVRTQVLPERTIVLGASQRARFRPPQMKLEQLRVPPWLARAHREWHQMRK